MNPYIITYAGGLRTSDAVVHQGRRGHVVSVPLEWVPAGEVPVMWDDEAGCFDLIPTDDLKIPQVVAVITAS